MTLAIVAAFCAAAAVFCLAAALARRLAPPPGEDAPSLEDLRGRWAKRAEQQMSDRARQGLKKQIVMAGGLSGLTPGQVTLRAAAALVIGLALGAWIVILTGWKPYWVLLATAVGALLPFIWLRDQVKKRHRDILRDLPFHLDLLTLCVEAGLDFTAGVAKAVESGRHGPLREELNSYLGELRMGKTRADALTAMSERVGLMELTNFLSALLQADRLGSGMGRTLRLQAEQLRSERFARAEKAAGEAPVKMLLPLVLFIFPTIWIVLAAPLVFQWLFTGAR